jgi:dTDP-4-dehydrorhamnose 3,5-epimerase
MASSAPVRPIAAFGELELAYPDQRENSLGAIILSPDSPERIDGVRIQAFPIYPDDRGYFMEVQRVGRGLVADFPHESTQISAALNYPGTIKAFHFHLHQTDCWTALTGMLQVALVDLRASSPTFGKRNTLYIGALRPWHVLVPPGVAHGYKVIGSDAAMLVYLTDRFYNPKDEGRIPYNDPSLAYDWETQRK